MHQKIRPLNILQNNQSILKNRVCIWFMVLAGLLSCRETMPKQTAESHLRAFDHTMMQLISELERSTTWHALERLFSAREVPLPFYAHHRPDNSKIRQFIFSENKGVYFFNESTGLYKKTAESDSIILMVRGADSNEPNITFILAQYEEQATDLDMMFPTIIHASLLVGETQLLRISHTGSIDYGVPAHSQMLITAENFSFHLEHHIRFRKRVSHLHAMCEVKKDDKSISSFSLQTALRNHEAGFISYRNLNFNWQMYPIHVDARIHNERIDANTRDYAAEFNRHSRIRVYSYPNKARVGEIALLDTGSDDRLHLVFLYHDGSHVLLEKLLITVSKVLGIKLPRQE